MNKPQYCLSPNIGNAKNSRQNKHEIQQYKSNASGLRESAPKPLFRLNYNTLIG